MRLDAIFTFVILIAQSKETSLKQKQEKEQKIRYDNYRVFKIKYESLQQRQLLLELTKQYHSFRLWNENNNELHLMVKPDALPQFERQLKRANASADNFISNVQHLIDLEHEATTKSSPIFGWTRYNNLAEIENWLDEILSAYPNVTESFVIGESYEGRKIRGVRISYKSGNPGVFIESNIHAREWITSATATWLINELLSSGDDLVRGLTESHDWYIVPVLNVDGFVYSHQKDRLWRKTRQPSNISSCIGADPNRNYDAHWLENGGASTNPCAEDYAGPHAFSEPEIKAMSEYVCGIRDKLNVMLAFHSYGQLLLSPYGHTKFEFPYNYDDLMQVAKAFGDAIEGLPYGAVYKYGSAAGILYPASGATNDWAFSQDIKISYTIEFRDTGNFGFVLPPAYILPNAEEALVGIIALLAEAKKLGYLQLKYDP
ncbi:zinc carboxypeptidase [Drosophila grimshawi]|uniref:GH10071 n=1 Tax=Drosophila grimshawi TaxID=7222 RepID=B4JD31_DROGR|nr:zinc carboxypeptidase [Drosophila grimshawi]EDW04275.1 GH10071 [Drosophila grimshawi]